MGFNQWKSVAKTEKRSQKRAFEIKDWNKLHLQIIFWGREFCQARSCYALECEICKKINPKESVDLSTNDLRSIKIYTDSITFTGAFMSSRADKIFSNNLNISDYDSDLWCATEKEADRQEDHIELIASENYASKRVLEAQGSLLTNKYAEGYPDKKDIMVVANMSMLLRI